MFDHVNPKIKIAAGVIEKHRKGDHFSDTELITAINVLEDILDFLLLAGPEYTLAANDIRRHFSNFRSYARARGLEDEL